MSLRDNHQYLEGLVEEAAVYAEFGFGGQDHDDLTQDLWETIEIKRWTVYTTCLRKKLFEHARWLAHLWRAETLRFFAQYTYTQADVERILETLLDQANWPRGFTPLSARTGERDGMAALEVRLDLMLAYSQLSHDLKIAIEDKYARLNDPVFDYEKDRLDRAIKEMTKTVNEYWEGFL